ncbi:MAG: Smr/MutS family protein [Acetobacteraceae bacterium]|nr:Smr/MutS family protein [Acetobacteraceae bacterium]
MRRRGLTDHDRRAWADYVQRVAPLSGVSVPDPPPPQDVATAQPLKPAAPPAIGAPRRSLAPLEIGASPGGVDRNTWMRFRGGKLPPQRTLDLHGRTVQHAHAELHAFLGSAMAERLRCVEIITGRGSGERGGVLRREVPLWLNDAALRPVILAASHPHPANQGAIRILLRRVR